MVTKIKLSDPTITTVSYGLDSVEDTPGLRKFKQGMGFDQEPLSQKILINPIVRWIKNGKIICMLNYLLNFYPKNNYLRKVHAILVQYGRCVSG